LEQLIKSRIVQSVNFQPLRRREKLTPFPACVVQFLAGSAAFALVASLSSAAEPIVDLSNAVIISADDAPGPERKAVQMLTEEVAKRTRVRWARETSWPTNDAPVIVVGNSASLQSIAKSRGTQIAMRNRREGYRIWIDRAPRPVVWVAGDDSRGVLFGVGHLLRTLHIESQKILLPADFRADAAPQTALRGHQLGYRPKCNSYDGWTVAMWEQYIRDLAVFGSNAIELIPPRSDDASDSPHFPLPQMEMMVEMSRLAADYGLDVWIWHPAMDANYTDAKTVEFALKEWGEVFRRLPRVDAVFVPGGDPGHTQPKVLFDLLEKQTANLRRFHPKAQMWVSPQSFNAAWMQEFFELMRREPAWLTGVVYGPQVRISLPQLRAGIPSRYPIRDYPDITHSRHCQYPVPDWDVAFAMTEGREPINPRPQAMTAIYRLLHTNTAGFITYSEGCNDDVNKMIWSALGWNQNTEVTEILRDYSRYFIGAAHAENFAEGLLLLEKNWKGPLRRNDQVEQTLRHFERLEREAAPQEKLNWRFQQALCRAYYDAYLRRRLTNEGEIEKAALAKLRDLIQATEKTASGSPSPSGRGSSGIQFVDKSNARGTDAALQLRDQRDSILPLPKGEGRGEGKGTARISGELDSLVALDAAEKILEQDTTRIAPDLRARVFELAEALFQSIRMQLSVPKYQAIALERGANLDAIDVPLNSREWLKKQFAAIAVLNSEAERCARIKEIVEWKNPGPGGFYDDLGDPEQQAHLVRGTGVAADPAFLESSFVSFIRNLRPEWPMSWWHWAEPLYDGPLQLRYTGLDTAARYRVRIVYGREGRAAKIRLVANEMTEIHPFLTRPFERLEFELPPASTRSGNLTLNWTQEPGEGGNGRGCEVAEVWLIKQSDNK
jgi:hypothetical protein